jgi:hypothetical protein
LGSSSSTGGKVAQRGETVRGPRPSVTGKDEMASQMAVSRGGGDVPDKVVQ